MLYYVWNMSNQNIPILKLCNCSMASKSVENNAY